MTPDMHLHSEAHSPLGKEVQGSPEQGMEGGTEADPSPSSPLGNCELGTPAEGMHHKAVSPVREP